MLHMILGCSGSGKSAALYAQIRQAAEAGRRVRALVPEQFSFTFDRLLYDALGAVRFNSIITGSFRNLTEELLEHIAEAPRNAADDVMRTVTLHRVLRHLTESNALTLYGRAAAKPGFLTELAAQIRELIQSGTAPEQLADAAAHTEPPLANKLLDIARIYADYLTELDSHGLRDTLCDQMTAAKYADSSRCLCGETVFLDEFESFTGDQREMLRVMLRDADDLWIALRTDDLEAPEFSRFDAVGQTARWLRDTAKSLGIGFEAIPLTEQHRFRSPSLGHLSRYLFSTEQNIPEYTEESAVTVCEATDITLEAEYTAAQIRQLLTSGAVRAREIAVVMHDASEYASLLEEAFTRYEIPFFIDHHRSVLHTAVMQLPLCLLALAHRSTTDAVLTLLKTQLSPLSPQHAAELENYAFIWDIEGSQWDSPFAEDTDPNGFCEKARQMLMEPVLKLREAVRRSGEKPVTGGDCCVALYRCIEAMGIPKRVGGLASKRKDAGDIAGGRALRALWNRFTELLDAMRDALADVPVTTQQLSELFAAVLRGVQIAVPPQTLDAVTVQSAAAARYDSPSVVFVLGVNAGLFPADISAGGFFSEQERARLADECKITLARSVRDLCADERLIVYKALSAASGQLFLCYPLADESGTVRRPSALIESVQTLLPKTAQRNAAELGAAFYVTTAAAAYQSFVQDYQITPAEQASVLAMLRARKDSAERLERLQRRRDPAALRISTPERMRALTGDTVQVSATFIDTAMKCPFRAFCSKGLRLYVRKKQDLNPLSGGNLVHYCMQQLFRQHSTREDFLAMTADDLRQHAETCAETFLQKELGGGNRRPQRFMENYRRMTARIIELLLHTQEEMRQSAFLPTDTELAIGRLGSEEEDHTQPFTLQLPNGIRICLNGRIDRVDSCTEDGKTYLRVVDYKTGRQDFLLANLYYGLNLQMLLYLFALLDDPTHYVGAEAAGVLYMPAGMPKSDRARSDMTPRADILAEYFRMHGTVLCDRGILSKMEQQIAGVYIPAKLAENDTGEGEPVLTKDSMVFTQEQLGRLRTYVEKVLSAELQAYSEGDVAPNPMKRVNPNDYDYYDDACARCDFADICGMDTERPAVCRKPEKREEITAKIRAVMDGTGEEESTDGDELDT